MNFDCTNNNNMKVYLIRNSEGLFFRPKGRGSYKSQWVTIDKAKYYTLSQAKVRLNYINGTICEYHLVYISDIDVSEEMQEKRQQKEIKKIEQSKRIREQQIQDLKRRIAEDQLTLNKVLIYHTKQD